MSVDWAVPLDTAEPSSAWDRCVLPGRLGVENPPVSSSELASAPVSGAALSKLADPPDEPKFGSEGNPSRPYNNAQDLGSGHHLTTVEVVKRNGKYITLLDGHAHECPAGKDPTKLWLPRFREQTVGGKRVVAPCCLGLRLEDGEFAPTSAHVVVTQRIYDDDRLIVTDEEVQRLPLTPYSVNALRCDVVTLPYPATHTAMPTVSIEDNSAVRRAEHGKYMESNTKFKQGVESVKGIFENGIVPDGFVLGPLEVIAALAGATDPAAPVVAAFSAMLPIYAARLLSLTLTTGPERRRLLTTEGSVVHIPLEEFVRVMERIVASRANVDADKEQVLGLTPDELRGRGMYTESVVLEWLLYGDASSETVDTTLDDNETLLERAQRVREENAAKETPWKKFQSLVGRDNTLTGNRLITTGLDPHEALETRVEYTYSIEIVDDATLVPTGEPRTRIVLDPLRANGVDAGWLMNDYGRLRADLEGVVEKLLNHIDKLPDAVSSNGKVADTTDDALKKGSKSVRAWAYITEGSGWYRDRRWEDLRRRNSKRVDIGERERRAKIYGVIAFDKELLRRRLRIEILGQKEKRKEGTDDAIAIRRRKEFLDENTGLLATINAEDAAVAYAEYEATQRNAFLTSRGLPAGAATVPTDNAFWGNIDESSPAFWRHRDTHMPIPTSEFVYAHPWRLLGWDVPAPDDELRPDPPGCVRRLPQYAVFERRLTASFGNTSVLGVVPVPLDANDSRRRAKRSVDAARRAWQLASADWQGIAFTVEPRDVLDELKSTSPVFHWVELRMRPDGALDCSSGAHELRVRTPLRVGGGVVPAPVAAAIYHVDNTPSSGRWEVEWATGAAPTGDAALLGALKLRPTHTSLMAVAAFCEALVYALVRAGATSRLVDYMRSTVGRAQDVAARAAAVIDLAYGSSAQRTGFLSRRDSFFECLVDLPAVREVLHHLTPWATAQTELERRVIGGEAITEEIWTPVLQRQASEFGAALRSLSRTLSVQPVRLASVALQSMWIRDNRVAQELAVKALPPSVAPWTALHAQLEEAVGCYGRVLAIVSRGRGGAAAPMCWAELSAFLECVAWHPVVLQADRATLQTRDLLTKRWVQPVVKGGDYTRLGRLSETVVSERMGAVRTDRLVDVRTEPATDASDPDSLLDRLGELYVVDRGLTSARYHVPPCGTAAALPGDVAHVAAVEDAVVYGKALADAIAAVWTPTLQNDESEASPRIEHAPMVSTDGASRHPYLMEVSGGGETVVLHLARMPPLDGSLRDECGDGPPPATAQELLTRVEKLMRSDEQRTVPGALRERARALLWNTERLVRASMALTVHLGANEAVARVVVPLEWEDDQASRRGVAVAVVLAQALCYASFASRVTLRMAGDQEGVRDAATRLVEPALYAAPLREVCVAIACQP